MRRQRDPSPPPPPAKKPKSADVKPWYHDRMCVLFETPNGFAIFHCCASLIEDSDVLDALWTDFTKKSDAHCLVWLKQFKTFEDKSSAINSGGVNKRLGKMVRKWYSPGMKLAVRNPEYKEIIQCSLKIPCVHGPAVMELMWGIQNCMASLVPGEKRKFTKEDRLPISRGLHAVLSRYGCVVEPEMVTDLIVNTASVLFWCDSVEEKHCTTLRNVGHLIKIVSGINCDDWSLLKVATAVKAIWWPEEIGYSCEEISEVEVSRLVKDRHKYEVLMDKSGCFEIYNDVLKAHDDKRTKEKLLKFLVNQAKSSKAKEAETVAAVN